MRIVHYLDNLDGRLGGIVRAVRNMVACQSADLDLTLVVRQAGQCADQRDSAQQAVELGGSQWAQGALSPHALRRFAQTMEGVDVLHLHSAWNPGAVQLARLARNLNAVVCLSPHGALDPWPLAQKRVKKSLYLQLVKTALYRQIDVVHTTCDLEATSVRANLPDARVDVVPLPLDQSSYELACMRSPFDKVDDRTHRKVSLVFLGRLHKKKRVDKAVDALDILVGRGYEASLKIIGTGLREYETFIENRIAARDLDNRVKIAGFVSDAERLKSLAESDAALVPSEHENFGFVCFEALACGTPLVTTPGVMTAQELASSGGALVSDGTPEGIAAKVVEILEHANPTRMGMNGKEWIVKNLDPVRLGDRYRRMYEAAVASRSKGAWNNKMAVG